MLSVLCVSYVVAGAANNTSPSGEKCRPFGECEPCPEDAVRLDHVKYRRSLNWLSLKKLSEEFCKPFGNRRLVHCASSSSSQGETPAWLSCGRIISTERADFTEFFGVNIVFAVLALIVLFIRRGRQEGEKRRALSARIWGGPGRLNG